MICQSEEVRSVQEESISLPEKKEEMLVLEPRIEVEDSLRLSQVHPLEPENSDQINENQLNEDEINEEIEEHEQVPQDAPLDEMMFEKKTGSNKLDESLNEECIEQLPMPQVVVESEEIFNKKILNCVRDSVVTSAVEREAGIPQTLPRNANFGQLIDENKCLKTSIQLSGVVADIRGFSGRPENDYVTESGCKTLEVRGIESPYIWPGVSRQGRLKRLYLQAECLSGDPRARVKRKIRPPGKDFLISNLGNGFGDVGVAGSLLLYAGSS